MKNAWIWVLIGIIILGFVGSFVFFKLSKDEDIIYSMYVKVNPLVNFKFKVKDDKAIVDSFSLGNDEARRLFHDVDFVGMELVSAIDVYGDKLSDAKLKFNTIYVWSNWDNKDYFKSDKYKLVVTIVDNEKIEDIPNETLPKFLLNTKYYDVNDEHGVSITFLENGALEYHLDQDYHVDDCGDCDDVSCPICDFTDEMYVNSSKIKQYRIDDDYVIIEAKDGEFYNGWHMSYDRCEIMFNRIKCDNYNAFHSNIPEYQYTVYYEIRN